MLKGTAILLAFSLAIAVAAPVAASPVTWSFAGQAFDTGIPEIPGGTPVTADWTFDPSAPNGCPAGDPTGFYPGQSATVTINSTIGPLVYHAAGGVLLVDTNLVVGCGPQSFSPGTVEARIFSWSGPDLNDMHLFLGSLPFPGGLFWDQAFSNGAAPAVQPHTVLLQGPFFFGASVSPSILTVEAGLQAVPEPATVGLVACGLSVLAIRRRRRGGPTR